MKDSTARNLSLVEAHREPNHNVGDLVRRITDDLKVIATNEVALARLELTAKVKVAAAEAAGVLLGGMLAILGLGLLCVALVPGLEGAVPPLWARMLIAAGVYLALGGGLAAFLVTRLKRDIKPRMDRTITEARRTADTIRREVRHG